METDNYSKKEDGHPVLSFPSEGTQVNGYTFIKKLGSNPSGSLWLIEDDERQYLTCRVFTRKKYETIREKADFIKNIDHKNIIKFIETIEHDDHILCLFEYIKGQTLTSYIEKRRNVDIFTGIEILYQAASAVQELHAAGISHGNLHPDNIIFTDYGKIKLTDVLSESVQNRKAELIKEIGENKVAFYAPEGLRGEPEAGKDDIYSLGALLYFLTTGVKPFHGLSPVKVFKNKTSKLPKSARSVNRAIDPKLDQFISRCLSINPNDRFPSLSEFLNELERHLKYYKIINRKEKIRGKRRFPLFTVIIVVLITVIVFLIIRGMNEDISFKSSSELTFHTKRIDPWGNQIQFRLEDGDTVYSNDGFQVEIKTRPGLIIQILNITPDRRLTTLYPLEGTISGNPSIHLESITLPDKNKFYRFDNVKGKETIFIILSFEQWK
ncbi:MAG: serine/threonine protein kinase, partial [Acidobacteria bacterium]|nr:serine/threonine protein kinase [Acidobacteriota bacterium]